MRVVLSKTARFDIHEIVSYIANDRPAAALRRGWRTQSRSCRAPYARGVQS